MIRSMDLQPWRNRLEDESFLPPSRLALLRQVAVLSAHLHFPAYLVGGFVRDLLLGQPVNDFDVVVEGDAIRLAQALAQAEGGEVLPHHKFGTAVWTLPDGSTLDLITARTEVYSEPGALPSVTFASIGDDLRRRDFTINAMALRLDENPFGELLDPLHGQRALQKGMIEVLHPRSFVDDPTRMFRALRYAGRYGFQMAHDTATLFNDEARAVLAGLSGERLRHEFDLLFEEERPAPILTGLHHYDLLQSIQPALASSESTLVLDEPPAAWGDFRVADILSMRQSLGWLTWLLSLSEEQVLTVSERLAFPVLLTRALRAASALHTDLPSLVDARPSGWTFRLDGMPALAVYAVYLRTQTPALSDYLSKWQFIHPRTSGDDLKVLGLPPGPRYQEILSRLRAAWLDGDVKSVGDEKKLLETLLVAKEPPQPPPRGHA